jgi:hypothetical protein
MYIFFIYVLCVFVIKFTLFKLTHLPVLPLCTTTLSTEGCIKESGSRLLVVDLRMDCLFWGVMGLIIIVVL